MFIWSCAIYRFLQKHIHTYSPLCSLYQAKTGQQNLAKKVSWVTNRCLCINSYSYLCSRT